MQNKVLQFGYIKDGTVCIVSSEFSQRQLYRKKMTMLRIQDRILKIEIRPKVADDDLVRAAVFRLVILNDFVSECQKGVM